MCSLRSTLPPAFSGSTLGGLCLLVLLTNRPPSHGLVQGHVSLPSTGYFLCSPSIICGARVNKKLLDIVGSEF